MYPSNEPLHKCRQGKYTRANSNTDVGIMRADADSDPQGRREEEEQNKQPGDLSSVDDPSNDDDFLIVKFNTGAGGFVVEGVAKPCRLVVEGLVVVCWRRADNVDI